jgi:hypothetical protein
MGQEQEEHEEKTEEQQHKLQLAKELARQSLAFGVFLNLQATWAASLSLPWGLAAAGAAATRTYVDAGDIKGAVDTAGQRLVVHPFIYSAFPSSRLPPSDDCSGTARATVLMVKLGFVDLVRDIVAKLAQQDRSDVVSQARLVQLVGSQPPEPALVPA